MRLAAEINMYILLTTYILSAAVLYVGRRQGRPVTWAIIVAWGVVGAVGIVLTVVGLNRAWVWVTLLLTLTPLMVRALVGDLQRHNWWVAVSDVAGLGAIAFSLGATATDAF